MANNKYLRCPKTTKAHCGVEVTAPGVIAAQSLLNFFRNVEDLQQGDGLVQSADGVDDPGGFANVADSEISVRLSIGFRLPLLFWAP